MKVWLDYPTEFQLEEVFWFGGYFLRGIVTDEMAMAIDINLELTNSQTQTLKFPHQGDCYSLFAMNTSISLALSIKMQFTLR